MQGFVWFQEETQGFRDGNYAKRFVITRPLAGLQYFLEEPLDPDLFKSIAASSNFEHGIKVSDIGGWVFGGNIVAESATMQPAIRFREIVLFPIKLKLLAPQSSTDLLFCLEN
ncbi:hypothetical protein EON64_05500 [archaeon]|nr:MAG: hypothetical protein EON64_05500 [archaeon]